MIKDYFKLAVKNLIKRKLRSWLTIIGIIVSVATIFVLISLSLGLQGAVEEHVRSLGADKLFIMTKGNFGPPTAQGAVTLTKEDVKIIEKVQGVKTVTYFVAGNAKVEHNDEIRFYAVYGIPADGLDLYFESNTMTVLEGQKLKNGLMGEISVGYDFEYGTLFDKPAHTGSKIKINEKEFKISGVLSRIGNPEDDKMILMSNDDFEALFSSGNRVDYIFIQVDNAAEIKDIADRIEKRLMSFRDVNEKTIDFTILTPEDLLNILKTVLNIITAFLAGVAAISLVVGAIGIANTMYTAVLERTKEIGVMKAVGAKNSDILLIFLIESGLIGLIGGFLGVLFGILTSKIVEYIAVNQLGTPLLKAALPPYLIIGCLLFAFIIGAVSGLVPARGASSVRPVDALRYE